MVRTDDWNYTKWLGPTTGITQVRFTSVVCLLYAVNKLLMSVSDLFNRPVKILKAGLNYCNIGNCTCTGRSPFAASGSANSSL